MPHLPSPTRAHAEDIDVMSVLFCDMLVQIAAMGGAATLPRTDVESFFRSRITERLQRQDTLYLVVRQQEGVVAALEAGVYTRSPPLAPETYFHIHAVYVKPAHRRSGVAKALMLHSIEWGREQGCDKAELNVTVSNPAVSLYERLGFDIAQQRMTREL